MSAQEMDPGSSDGVQLMAALLGLAAGVLALLGRRTFRTAPTPGERTHEILKENGRWARRQIAR